jgi:predicted nucleic acid-binding protein
VNVIVDTSVWSYALRRRRSQEHPSVGVLQQLVVDGQVRILGCIRQGILSGIRSPEQFRLLRDQLRAFPDEVLESKDYERAAEFFNTCRQKGIQGSNTDFLICAVAVNRDYSILTADQDLREFQRVLGFKLFAF